MRPSRRIGNERSKIYSGSKFSNWTKFNPFNSEIRALPKDFLQGLDSIYLLSGTKKQNKISFSRLFRFGCYSYDKKIYLHAFPKDMLRVVFKKKTPRPDIFEEYKRAGAKIKETSNGVEIVFNENSLKTFFIKDVLMHEIGHHVDRFNSDKSNKRPEKFAEWFAFEYGYRLITK